MNRTKIIEHYKKFMQLDKMQEDYQIDIDWMQAFIEDNNLVNKNVTNCNFKSVVALYEDVNSKLAVSEQILPVHKGDKMTINNTCYEVDYVDYDFDKAIFEIVVTDDS